MPEDIINFDGILENEVLVWLSDALEALDTFDVETEDHYQEQTSKARKLCLDCVTPLQDARRAVAELVKAAQKFRDEQDIE